MKGTDYMNSQIDYTAIAKVVCDTLSMLGINAQLKNEVCYSTDCKVSNSVLAMVGVLGNIKFNMICSMEMKTAENIVAIMMGATEYSMDSIGRSGIAELSNMLSGSICTALSVDGTSLDITTPTVLTGEIVSCTIHSVESRHMEFETQLGLIRIAFAFET